MTITTVCMLKNTSFYYLHIVWYSISLQRCKSNHHFFALHVLFALQKIRQHVIYERHRKKHDYKKKISANF